MIRRVLERVANQAANRSGSTRAGARVATMSGVVANVWRFFVFVVAGAIVLGMLGINLTPLLASATIIGATLGFGAQQIVRDYFSGILMTMEDQYNVGDSVTVGGVTGVVEEVTMRLTRFRGVDGTIYVIPNGDIRLVGNLSRGWARAIVDLTLPGAGAADLETVRSVIAAAAHEVATSPAFAGHCTEPPTVVGLAIGRRDDDHHAGDAAHRPLAARRAHPGAARGGAGGAGQGRAVARGDRAAGHARCATRRPPERLRPRRSQASRDRPPRRPATWPRPERAAPVHSSSCAAAWCTSMPSPSTRWAPAAAASASHGVGRGA